MAVSSIKEMRANLPRFIRLRDAPFYLGMDRNRFNRDVRPYVDEVSIGKQGVAFDRLDLDAWADDYKQHNTQRVKGQIPQPVSSEIGEFERALSLARSKAQKPP